jgi:hypothetical protein
MVENTIVTLLGSESTDLQHTKFSSTTSWSPGAGDLIVYKNGVLLTNGADYTVLSTSSIQLNSAIQANDKIMIMVTTLTELSGLATYDDRVVQVDRVSKKLEGLVQTSVEKRTFEETIPSNFIIASNDVWSSVIDPTPSNAVSQGFAYEHTKFSLTQDITVSFNRGWYASSNGQVNGRITNWIPPRFGQAYTIRLFDSSGNEIPSSDPMNWKWDYQAGYLFIENSFSYSTPFKVSAWTYTGNYGTGASGSSYWENPVPTYSALPIYQNVDGDMRLTLDTSTIWRWNSLQNQWVSTNYASARYKDPVADITNLPKTANIDGDVRLVLDANAMYRWNASLSVWQVILPVHNHDDRYYTEAEINTMLTQYAPLLHNHDSLYYRKEEVDSMVRWRPSVANQAQLPPYTENRDGDVILTRDQNVIWRWIGTGANPQWVPIVQGNLTWKPPVQNYSNLPTAGNNVGDVRLVINNNGLAYWWDGTTWLNFSLPPHDHDGVNSEKVNYNDLLNLPTVYWNPPVNTVANLPASNNIDGSITLTLSNNNVYRWNSAASKWILISASPSWREMVPSITNLPAIGNSDGDIRYVVQQQLLYEWNASTATWGPIGGQPINIGDYYTKEQLDGGQLDNRYFTQTQIDAMFNVNTGHNHDGVNSKKIDYNSLLNIPVFNWKAPVADTASLPMTGNALGDARLTLNNPGCYVWTGIMWYLVGSGLFAPIDQNFDNRYYTQTQIDGMLQDLRAWVTVQLANMNSQFNTELGNYYTKPQIDEMFNINTGHDHDGYNSKRISYYDLINLPNIPQFDPNDYWTKQQLATPQNPPAQMVNWANIFGQPDLANGNWKSPVQDVNNLPTTNNSIGDIRLVLDTSNIYEWDGNQWNMLGTWQNMYVAFWREPIDTYVDLPVNNLNVNGDVRLVLDENKLYRWDSTLNMWVSLVSTATDIQVYLNGLNLNEMTEWIRTNERTIMITAMDPQNPNQSAVKDGDLVTVIITGDYYERQDFVAQMNQTTFTIAASQYHREDIVVTGAPTIINLNFPYIMHTANLIVWLNGLIQLVNVDYFETSPTQFVFTNALQNGDHVIAIITAQASGVGSYVREDQLATAGQTIATLNNFYVPGSGTLLFYLNGDLLRSGNDYYEMSNTTVETIYPMKDGDRLSFLLFAAGVEGGCCNAQDVILGMPSDNTWNDGLLYFFEKMKVNDAIDKINETLLQMAPPAPTTFNGADLVLSITLYPGYESQGNVNYETTAGAYHTYLTESTSFTIRTPDQTGFADADKGILTLYINNAMIDQFNLYNAFVVGNQNGNQSSISYGSLAQGARADEGVIGSNGYIRTSVGGKISIISIGKFNNFYLWQKGEAAINITPGLLRQGYNTIYLTHQDGTNFTRTSNVLELFLDTAGSRPNIDVNPTLVAQYPQASTNYISGVRYFSIGDSFTTAFIAVAVFNNTYVMTPLMLSMPGLQPLTIAYNDPRIAGPVSPPNIGDLLEFNGPVTLNKFNDYSINAIMTIACQDPFGNGTPGQTAAVNYMVNTYLNKSTDLIEYFVDENYRLPIAPYDSIPMRTGQWSSQTILTNGNALIFNLGLMYPNINFTTLYRPQPQVANYSSFAGPQVYLRSFYKVAAKNNGSLIINGIAQSDLVNNRILVDIKLPTQTGWLSLNKPYDVITFKGADGDGCFLTSSSGQQFNYSSGTYSTANSGYMVVVRVTLPTTLAPIITYMEMQW